MEVPYDRLPPQTLRNLVTEYVSREGTDYGHREWDMDQKVEQVLDQIRRGEVRILFDPEAETCNLVTREQAKHIMAVLNDEDDEDDDGLAEDS